MRFHIERGMNVRVEKTEPFTSNQFFWHPDMDGMNGRTVRVRAVQPNGSIIIAHDGVEWSLLPHWVRPT